MSSLCALDTMRAFTREDDVILLKSGEVLFRPGETGTTMFGLLEGAIRITWIGQAGQNGHEDIPVGHVFGAGALVMEGHKRLGMATATTDCRLIEMTREKFLFALHETPMFALELLASIDERLRDIKMADK
jgi:CRP-like cAMP-binding protein